MTIRQISEITGCHYKTVSRVGKQMFPNVKAKSRGIPIEYSDDQSQDLILHLPKRNMVQIDQPIGVNAPTDQSGQNALMLQLLQQNQIIMQTMVKIVERMDNFNAVPQKPEPVKIEDKREPVKKEISDRKKISIKVNRYCHRTGCEQREAYRDLYRDFNNRYNKNVHLRAKNKNIKCIDAVEEIGMIPELLYVAEQMFADDML
jgi:predicted HicB family RNase H-like nuclease